MGGKKDSTSNEEGCGSRVKVAFVHGSFTKDSMKADSDVDIVVIGTCRFAEVVYPIGHARDKLGMEANPSVYPEAEFKEKIAKKRHFLTTILKKPRIFSIGDGNELGRQIVSKRPPSCRTFIKEYGTGFPLDLTNM